MDWIYWRHIIHQPLFYRLIGIARKGFDPDPGWTQKFKRHTTGCAVEHSGRYFCKLLKRSARISSACECSLVCLLPLKVLVIIERCDATTKQIYFYPLSAAPYACQNDFLRFQQHSCMQSWLHTTKREGVDDKPHIRSEEEKGLWEMWLDRKICGCDNEKLKPRFLKIFAIKSF